MDLDNKTAAKLTAKDAVQEAFDALGGVPGLTRWGQSNPDAFYGQLYGKLVQSSLTVSLKDVPPIIINLPWLHSRPGPQSRAPQEVIDITPVSSVEAAQNDTANDLPVRAEDSVHTVPQSNNKRRLTSVPSKKREDRGTGKRPGDRGDRD